MATILVFLNLFYSTNAYSLTDFTLESSPPPPLDGASWIVHYDSSTKLIYMLDGSPWTNQFVYSAASQTYNIETNTWQTIANTPSLTKHDTQEAYTSIGDTVYFVGDGIFGSFNPKTDTFLYPHPNITLPTQTKQSCVTSDGSRYIFIISGWWSNSYIPQFQIYDLQNNQWLNDLGNMPNINNPRAYHSCQYHKGFIYVFGGWIGTQNSANTDLIEVIHVGTGDNVFNTVTSEIWLELPARLNTIERETMSVMCENVDTEEIYIFGGFHQSISNRAYVYNTIEIFNTTDNSITIAPFTLQTPRAAAFAICIENYIYVMLGWNVCGNSCRETLFTWEKSNPLYTFAPTKSPTSIPSATPTKFPSLSPTLQPTLSPSNNPTLQPSNGPSAFTFAPTKTPTVPPTNPTLQPSYGPSYAPSYGPSYAPSYGPSIFTINPTTAPIQSMDVANVFVFFSCSYLELFVNISNVASIYPLMFTCADIFDTTTNNLLINSVCSWSNYEHTTGIIVSLSATSDILIDSSVTIKSGVFRYYKYNQWVVNQAITILNIQKQCITSPHINLITPNIIGICDDLLLDSRGVISNLGGRNPQSIKWHILMNGNISVHTTTEHILFPYNVITPGTMIHYTLTVKSWYNESATINGSIEKSQNPIPFVRLITPSTFNSDSKQIVIESIISFTDSCLNNSNTFSLSYSWSVIHKSIISGTINSVLFSQLNNFVDSNSDKYLVIDKDKYLQKGVEYEFILNVACNGYYICSQSDSVSIQYQYSPIICQIKGGNKILKLPISSISAFSMELDGNLWSYDPDGNVLKYMWSCNHLNSNCSQTLLSSNSAVTSAVFTDIMYEIDHSYIYEFVLTVSDQNILSRETCQDTMRLQLDIVADNSNDITEVLVSLSATTTSINVADKLRLIGLLTYLNGTEIVDNNNLFYEWSVANDLLTVSQIKMYQINEHHVKYLVLGANVLTMGTNYEFILNVYSNNDKTMLLGSASIHIHVKSGPIILENGFSIDSICNRQFNDFKASLFYGFNLYTTADGDFPPLLYKFHMLLDDTITYLHSYPQTFPHLFHAILPIECNFSIIASVFDSEESMDSESINCCTSILSNDNDCFSYQTDIIDVYFATDNAYNLLSNSQINRYIFQTSFNVLHYLPNINENNNNNCKYNHFKEVIDVLNIYFNAGVSNLCSTSDTYLFILQLSQTLCKWFSVGVENPVFLQTLIEDEDGNDDYFAIIYGLVTQTLDPCQTIREFIQTTDRLSISQESVIINKIIVLYDDIDITDELSILLINTNYIHSLYQYINVFVDYLSIYASEIMENSQSDVTINEIVIFLEKVLYISGLASISTTIPTEYVNITLDNFQIYTIRNDSSLIDVIVNDVEIVLDLDDDNDNKGKPKDIVVFGITVDPQENISYIGYEDCYKHSVGNLDGNEVSITVVNATNSSMVNVTMKFKANMNDNQPMDNGIACVWWNEQSNKWDSNGCYSELDENNEYIVCTCNHLTTFSTISHLHNECDDKLFNEENGVISYIMILFAILFLILLVWILGKLFRYKFVYQKSLLKTKPLRVMVTCAIITFIQFLICILFYTYSLRKNITNDKGVINDIYVALLTMILLIPFVLYYYMFSIVVSTWINVAHAMHKSQSARNFKYILKMSTIPVCIIFALIIILIISLKNNITARNTVITIGEISWCILMTLSVIIFSIYGFRMIKMLHAANKIVHDKNAESYKTEKRIIIIVIAICTFFITQCALTIYFSIDRNALNMYWRIADLLINFICLLMICWMYHRKLNSVQYGERIGSTTNTNASKQGVTRLEMSTTGTRTHIQIGATSPLSSPATSPKHKVPAFAYTNENKHEMIASQSVTSVIPTVMDELHNTLTPGGPSGIQTNSNVE